MADRTEFRLHSRSLPFPLTIDQVIFATTLGSDDKGQEEYRLMTDDEREWIEYISGVAGELMADLDELIKESERGTSPRYFFHKFQYACAFALLQRCIALVGREQRNLKRLTHAQTSSSLHRDEFEAENKRLKAQLEDANRRAAEVEERAASYRDIENHGLCSVVIRMRREGKRDEEVAVALQGFGCSNAQIGALLHLDSAVSEGARTKLAQRLLGKA